MSLLPGPVRPRPRRAGAAAALALALVVGACGGDDGDDAGPTGGDGDAPPAAEEGAFPVTIEHSMGTTEIPEQPERVVTVGFTDQDTVLAFDVVPVGVRDWYGDQPDSTFPWAQEAMGDADPAIVGDGSSLNVEAVAALRPDLIVAIYEQLDESTYTTLSELAPVVTQSAEYQPYAQPWQETTRMVGAALGRPDRAEELIADVEAAYEEARAAHPEFAGTTAAMAQFGDSPGFFYLTYPEDPKASFLSELGFTFPEEISELVEENEGEEVSYENLDLVDQGIAVWIAGVESPELVESLRDDPLYRDLAVAREGRDLFLEEGVDELSWGTVLSIPAAIDVVVPQLADVLAGSGGAGGAGEGASADG